MSRLLDAIVDRSLSFPDRIAIRNDRETLSYGDLAARIAARAVHIRATIGDRSGPVGIALPNGLDWILTDLALLALHLPCVPLPPFFSMAQSEAALADAGAIAVVSTDGIALLHHIPADVPAGTAKISYTSGSTAAPKGICLSDDAMLATASAVVARFGAGMAGVHMPVLPLGVLLENVAGLYASLLAGGTYAAYDGANIGLGNPFQPDMPTLIEAVQSTGATSLILVPELLAGLAATLAAGQWRLPGLRLVAVGGARVPIDLLAAAEAVNLPVVQGYGLTECGSVVTIEQPGEVSRGTTGAPLDHVTISIADDGEIIVNGTGHLGTIGAPRSAGPIATGDIGRLDAAGRLIVEGRKSNLLITGYGRNVSPEWVEEVLLAQPVIAQAMVYGDGAASLSALLVPCARDADLAAAVAEANSRLPAYARIDTWQPSRPFSPQDGTLTANGRLRRTAILRRAADLPFFDQLVARTAPVRARLLAVPQLRAGLAGRIDRQTYLAYLAQAYHHVRHTVPLLREARDRLGHRPVLKSALDDYIAEESGHEQWILDDIAAAGGDPARAVADGPSPATAAMIDHAYRTIREGNAAGLFGMVFVLEGTSIALASSGAGAVRASLNLPETAFRYLTSHGALDQDHMRFFETHMNQIDDVADREAIVAMAEAMFDLFGGVFAAIPMESLNETA
ncbi:Long-chain acyl-CoA synthetase (AMP-forming) [Sphingomonas sp. YR710]|uniref:AMP-binding protein n=1 Tax=Sphingomonas sp. YR710 TaxID=1882773 RepID=UPI000890148C|nr:AMP-binding protein [Sphingomonas sp. YR710]SDD02932.1 Long-chain acyl-CoA synthetase (AMP-forming) [Sphingomonas sp. YR710]